METKGASAISLDGYLDHAKIQNVSFIQMDVDGKECNVLLGSQAILMRQKPLIIMELAPYPGQKYDHWVEELLDLFGSVGYTIPSLTTGMARPKEPHAIKRLVAEGSSIHVIAGPL